MGTELTVRRAGPADREPLIAALRAATPDEAVTEWILRGHPVEQFLEAWAPEIADRGLHQDEIWVAGAGTEIWTVSVWQHMTSPEPLLAQAATAREQAERAPEVRPLHRAAYVAGLVARVHPPTFPHSYLELIVTVPRYRGRGAGAAVLATRTRELAAAGLPAYLEASTERSARLYTRQGFVRTGETHTLPEDGPTLVPMWFAA